MSAEGVGTLPFMAVYTDAGEPLHLLSVEDVERMVESGVLDEDDRCELLDGVLVEVSPQGPPHWLVLYRLGEWAIRGNTDERLAVGIGGPLRLPPYSMPEPDLQVFNRADVTRERLAAWAHLAIEVSHASLRQDLGRKAKIYARAGIPEYWVIDVDRLVVHVHRDPEGPKCRDVRRYEPPAVLTPAGVDLPPLDLAGLLAQG